MTEPSQTSAPARLQDESFTLPLSPPPEESRVWIDRVAPLLDGVSENVVDICSYGFTEMLNNAVDHSGGTTVAVRIVRTAADIELRIADDGVGIFHKIATELHLDDERHAVLELSKGKLTTAATMHSGEGIFFTSRMFDRFSLASGDVSLVCRADERWTLTHGAPDARPPASRGRDGRPGTVVDLRIALASARSQKEVYDRFSAPLAEDYGFIRTQVPVALTRHAEEKLVSRSQAKRLVARFDRFKEVVLDFTDVQTVGQAFADEVFRVFAGMHPDIHLTWTGAVPDVERMIRRAIAARSATGDAPAALLPDAPAPPPSAKKVVDVSLARLGGHARRAMTSPESELGEPEVAILHMVGLFDRPAEEDEIAALRAEPIVPGLTDALVGVDGRAWMRAVAKLERAGLLTKHDDRRLDAPLRVREHFGEELEREQPEAWREGHRRLYEHLKNKAELLPETVEGMAPLYAAVVHGCRAGRAQEAFREVWWERIQRENEHFSTRKLGAFGREVTALSAFFDPPWERLAPGLSDADAAALMGHTGLALRALGQLPEAARMTRMALEHLIAQGDWFNASIGASNLCEILQVRGELREALEQARSSVRLADESRDAAERWSDRTTLAACLHAMGLRAEAAVYFQEAERMQRESQPAYPLLDSLWGFRYCDLLLDEGRDAEVRERAERMLSWEQEDYPLDTSLDHLSLGRSSLLAVQRRTGGDLDETASHLQRAVDGLRRAGMQDMLPLGLLARAALHTHTRAFADARRDLDEALALATRCGVRLHEADAHLAFARLALAEGDRPAARAHLDKARAIIDATGYHRRDGELAELDAACG
jgi:tetratricopeptide (TPR) repeat protein/anti-sigma regulatory factor (Ser/Thr protein kinase)